MTRASLVLSLCLKVRNARVPQVASIGTRTLMKAAPFTTTWTCTTEACATTQCHHSLSPKATPSSSTMTMDFQALARSLKAPTRAIEAKNCSASALNTPMACHLSSSDARSRALPLGIGRLSPRLSRRRLNITPVLLTTTTHTLSGTKLKR